MRKNVSSFLTLWNLTFLLLLLSLIYFLFPFDIFQPDSAHKVGLNPNATLAIESFISSKQQQAANSRNEDSGIGFTSSLSSILGALGDFKDLGFENPFSDVEQENERQEFRDRINGLNKKVKGLEGFIKQLEKLIDPKKTREIFDLKLKLTDQIIPAQSDVPYFCETKKSITPRKISKFNLIDPINVNDCPKEDIVKAKIRGSNKGFKVCVFSKEEDTGMSQSHRNDADFGVYIRNWITNAVTRYQGERKVVIDVGSFIGFYGGSAAASSNNTRIFLFEPYIYSARRSAMMAKLNGWDEDRVLVFNNAVFDDVGKSRIEAGVKNTAATNWFMDGGGNIDTIVLDDLVHIGVLDPKDVLLLKIELGNHIDQRVLNGFSKILRDGRPPYIKLGSSIFHTGSCDIEKFLQMMVNEYGYIPVIYGEKLDFEGVVKRLADGRIDNIFFEHKDVPSGF